MRFLFFFVHPSKYHLFRHTINNLRKDGHNIEILITSKDVLEDLVKSEKWNYKNIFPEGRKIKNLPTKFGAIINLVRTLVRLHRYCSKKSFDLFITDDLLTITGRILGVPSILFQDDDLSAVPESFILLASATYVLAPRWTNFGRYEKKKLGFQGFKQSAYLHPNYFRANPIIASKYIDISRPVFVIRLVSLTATHDVGKNGLNDLCVTELVKILEKHGNIYISSERKLSEPLLKYKLNLKSEDLIHIVAFASLFISDSQTMSAEAAFLGTPYIRFNDFIGLIRYLEVLENDYKMGIGIPSHEKDMLFDKIESLMEIKSLREYYAERYDHLLKDTVDLTSVMLDLFKNYPKSIDEFQNRKS